MKITLQLKSNNSEGIILYPPFTQNNLIRVLLKLGLNENSLESYNKDYEVVDWNMDYIELEEELKNINDIHEVLGLLDELQYIESKGDIEWMLACKETFNEDIWRACLYYEDYSQYWGDTTPRDIAKIILLENYDIDELLVNHLLNNLNCEKFMNEWTRFKKTKYGYITLQY